MDDNEPTSQERARTRRLQRFFIYFARSLLGGTEAEELIRSLQIEKLRSLFYFALQEHNRQDKINYYEFGVGWGGTLSKFVRAAQAFSSDYNRHLEDFRIFLFDSFEGLPEKTGPRDDYRDWERGKYAHTVEEISRKLSSWKVDPGTVRFVKGFYKDSLTAKLRSELSTQPPDIITIDVDYYSSCIQVLAWIRPLLRSGSIFYFDDIWTFSGNPRFGELAAIEEFNVNNLDKIVPYRRIAPSSFADNCFIYYKDSWDS